MILIIYRTAIKFLSNVLSWGEKKKKQLVDLTAYNMDTATAKIVNVAN